MALLIGMVNVFPCMDLGLVVEVKQILLSPIFHVVVSFSMADFTLDTMHSNYTAQYYYVCQL